MGCIHLNIRLHLLLCLAGAVAIIVCGVYALQPHTIWYKYVVADFEMDEDKGSPFMEELYKYCTISLWIGVVAECILGLMILIFMLFKIERHRHAKLLRMLAILLAFLGLAAFLFSGLYFLRHPNEMRKELFYKLLCLSTRGPCSSFIGTAGHDWHWGPGPAWIAVMIGAGISLVEFVLAVGLHSSHRGFYEIIK